jgi:hypothetical protein
MAQAPKMPGFIEQYFMKHCSSIVSDISPETALREDTSHATAMILGMMA